MATYVGRPCKNGHLSGERYQKSGTCVECAKGFSRVAYSNKPKRNRLLIVEAPTIYPGAKFGRLEVIEELSRNGAGTKWLCRCECGEERICQAFILSQDRAKECQRCMDVKKPYQFAARNDDVRTVVHALRAAGTIEAERLRSTIGMREDPFYDCIAVLFQRRQLKIDSSGTGRKYALAA